MMTLYFSPDVCSLPVHIALREAGAAFELVRVDLRTRRTSAGADYLALAPKGYVPALALPSGELLTETAALLGYVADAHPAAALAPPRGSFERVRHDEWLTFLSAELHKGFAPFTLMPGVGDELRAWARARLEGRVAHLARHLAEGQYLVGGTYSVADAYAFWALRTYSRLLRADLAPPLRAYVDRIAARDAVAAALSAEKQAR